MRNTTATPIIHNFHEISIGKYKATSHYEIINTINGDNQLTDLINISKNRFCAKSNPDFWAQTRTNNKWDKPRLTGLFYTGVDAIYYGDTQEKKNLLLFKFNGSDNTLTVYFYADFYTKNLKTLIKTIQ